MSFIDYLALGIIGFGTLTFIGGFFWINHKYPRKRYSPCKK